MVLERNNLQPLTKVGTGQVVRLVNIAAGSTLVRRLTELGLTPGVEFEVIQAQGGPVLLAVRDARLALGRGMAHKILVEYV